MGSWQENIGSAIDTVNTDQTITGKDKAIATYPRYIYIILVVFLFLSYARPQDIFPSLNVFHMPMVLISILTIDVAILRFGMCRFFINVSDKMIFAFLMAMILSIVSSIWISQSIISISEFIKIYLTCFLIINVANTRDRIHGLMKVIVIASFLISIVQIIVYLYAGVNRITGLGGYGLNFAQIISSSQSAEGVGGYVNGFLGNASDLGVGMLVALPLAIFLSLYERNGSLKILYRIIALCFLISIILSGSRGAYLGLGVIALYHWLNSKRKALLLVTILSVLAVSVVFVLPGKLIARVKSIQAYTSDESTNIRMELWNAGLRIFIDHPVLGVGVGNFPTAYGQSYHPEKSGGVAWWNPHNIFIHTLSEMGLVGFLAYIGLIVSIYRQNRTFGKGRGSKAGRHLVNDNARNALNYSLFGFLISGQFITVTYYPHLFYLGALSSVYYSIGKGLSEDQHRSRFPEDGNESRDSRYPL